MQIMSQHETVLVTMFLGANFKLDKEKDVWSWAPGWSDARIAAELKSPRVTPEHVERLRKKCFGSVPKRAPKKSAPKALAKANALEKRFAELEARLIQVEHQQLLLLAPRRDGNGATAPQLELYESGSAAA